MAAVLKEFPMSRKKTEGNGPEKKKPEPGFKRNIVSIRGTEEWRDWLMGLAAHRRLKAADVIDQALIEYAQKYGYTKPAPPR